MPIFLRLKIGIKLSGSLAVKKKFTDSEVEKLEYAPLFHGGIDAPSEAVGRSDERVKGRCLGGEEMNRGKTL